MTRQDITTLCKDTLGELLGTPEAADPFAWDRLIDTAASDVCRATDCLSVVVGADVVANQQVYCLPQLYRITGAFFTNPALRRRQLVETLPSDLDYRFIGWRNDPPGDPKYFLPLGLNEFWLYPTPETSSALTSYTDLVLQTNPTQVASAAQPFETTNTGQTLRITKGSPAGFTPGAYVILSVDGSGNATLDRPAGTGGTTEGLGVLSAGGLEVEGFGIPAGRWPLPSDECPLPERGHMAVVYRACLLRILQKSTPENMARRPMLQQEYEQAKAKLGREVRQFSQATKNADNQRLTNRMQWW